PSPLTAEAERGYHPRPGCPRRSQAMSRHLPTSSLRVEELESRVTPAISTTPGVSASLVNGTLSVVGTPGNDQIIVQQSNGRLTISGVPGSFAVAGVHRLEISGGAGDDFIDVGRLAPVKKKPIAVKINGGDGNDTILGGPGNDTIFGGAGNDIIA